MAEAFLHLFVQFALHVLADSGQALIHFAANLLQFFARASFQLQKTEFQRLRGFDLHDAGFFAPLRKLRFDPLLNLLEFLVQPVGKFLPQIAGRTGDAFRRIGKAALQQMRQIGLLLGEILPHRAANFAVVFEGANGDHQVNGECNQNNQAEQQ